MRGLRRVAHAPPAPAEHARLACFARVRGPAAPRRQSLVALRATAPCKVMSPSSRGRGVGLRLDGAGAASRSLKHVGFVGKTAAPLREWPRMSRLWGTIRP